MLNVSPRLALDRLAADGSIQATAAGNVPAPRILLLDRRLCVFERFVSPMTGTAARAAARLYARTSAPFMTADFVLTPGLGGFGIWWWDAAKVGEALATHNIRPSAVLPETLAQPPGEGWRQVRLASGYEAQHWVQGVLVDSLWRPARLSESDWRAFTRVASELGDPAPILPPAPVPLPVIGHPRLLGHAIRRWDMRRLALIGAALATLSVGGMFAGQALTLNREAERLEGESAAILAALPSEDEGRRERLARIQDYHAQLEQPDAAASLAVAIGVLQLYGITPSSFRADHEQVRLTLPYTAADLAGEVAYALADAGGFSEVEIASADSRRNLVLEMRPPASGQAGQALDLSGAG